MPIGLKNELFVLAPSRIDLSLDVLCEKLDLSVYRQRLQLSEFSSPGEKIDRLESDRIIVKQSDKCFAITNLGGLLLAKNFQEFPSLWRREIRLVQYLGTSRKDIVRHKDFDCGYAVCIPDLFNYIDALLPSSEPISSSGIREVCRPYSLPDVENLLVNALIQQDLTSPDYVTCEIFKDRVEITFPGVRRREEVPQIRR